MEMFDPLREWWTDFRRKRQQPEYDPESIEGIQADALKGQRMQEYAAMLAENNQYIPNSGWLGVVAKVANDWQGKRKGEEGDRTVASALARQMKLDEEKKQQEAEAAMRAEIAKEQREIQAAREKAIAAAQAKRDYAAKQFTGGGVFDPAAGKWEGVPEYAQTQEQLASAKAAAAARNRGPTGAESKVAQLRALGASDDEIKAALVGGRKQRISVGADGGLTIEEGGIGEPTTAAVTHMQKDLLNAYDSLDQLKLAGQNMRDEYLTYKGRVKAKAGALMDKAGVENELTQWSAQRDGSLTQVEQFFNAYRHMITGAAAAEKELQALKKATINNELGPQAFWARYNQLVNSMESDITRYQQRLGAPQLPQMGTGNVVRRPAGAAPSVDDDPLGLR